MHYSIQIVGGNQKFLCEMRFKQEQMIINERPIFAVRPYIMNSYL